jgi:hypothetical protein
MVIKKNQLDNIIPPEIFPVHSSLSRSGEVLKGLNLNISGRI